MAFWGSPWRRARGLHSRRSSATKKRLPSRIRCGLPIERLEDRALLTVTSAFIDGQFSVISDWNDDIVLSVELGQLKVNGIDPDIGPVAAADVTGLSVRGGLLSRLIDASGTSGRLPLNGVSIAMPRISEYVAELYATTPLEGQLTAAFDSGLLTQDDITRVTLGYVDGDLLDRLAQTGISQELIDKGLEAIAFFHADDAEDPLDAFHAGQSLMSASVPNNDPVVYGTIGNDNLTGGEGSQTFYGGQGNDHINGGEGNDVIYGGSGDDYLDGGEGKSANYFGPSDNDTMYGGDGYDTWADGGEGTDTFDQGGPNYDFANPEPVVTISDVRVDEMAGYAIFGVTLNDDYSDAVSIPWNTVNGTALAGSDFTSSSGTLTIPAGQTAGTISVPITNDTDNETDESFSVVLGTPTNATLGDNSGLAIIFDNDTPSGSMPTASIDSAGPIEEAYGGAIFTVTLSQAINKTVRVHYATGGGTAIAGTHYTATSGDLYFAPNVTTQYVTVTWTDDTMYEGSTSAPYFFVSLSSPLNAQIGTASGYAQIINDDPLPTLSINDATVTEGDPGGPAVNATFTLSLTNPIDVPIAVALSIGPGTALYSSDYSGPTTINVTIPSGQTSAQFSVPITADLTPEPQDFFYATVTSAGVYTTDYQGTCTINDQDTDPEITSDDPIATEGDPGDPAHYVTFTLSLSKASQKQVSVEVSTEDLTALKVADYVQVPNTPITTITFAPGVTTRQVQVQIVDDLKVESSEQFRLNLSNPTNATTAIDFAIGTIKDDDVDIDADINRSGIVEDTEDEETHELDYGTIVIADKENVYADPNEPARRREIVLRNGDNAPVRVNRSGEKLKLYSAATGGDELFGGQNEITLASGRSYWLQGGADPSAGVCTEFLRVRQDNNNAPYKDRVNVTVLWVEISGHNQGNMKLTPVFDGAVDVFATQGHDDLGVQASNAAIGDDPPTAARGIIEVRGSVLPADATRNAFGTSLTTGFTGGAGTGTPNATATFGFAFRRTVSYADYENGFTPAVRDGTKIDDSPRKYQDPDPDLDVQTNKLLIVDNDGVGAGVTDEAYFFHTRNDFDERVVFTYSGNIPERASGIMQWAFSGDTALDYNNHVAFIRDAPNNGFGTNDVYVGTHLSSRTLGVISAPMIATAETAAHDKRIARNTEVEVTITGTNLVGKVYLENGVTSIEAKIVRVKSENGYSALTEVKATFKVVEPVGQGYVLTMENAAGFSNPIAGFEIV